MSSKVFNVAIIGYGFFAKVFHIPLILPISSLKLYGIVQRNPKPDDDASKDFSDIKTWRSSDEMLKDAKVDLVVITTLPSSHFELAKAALEAGKGVVVEKPFAPTSTEAEELCAIAKRTGKLLTVYQNRRWDGDFVTAKKLIQEGTLGRVLEFQTHFDRFEPESSETWRAQALPGVGQIYDLGGHLLDQVVHLFGLPKRGFAVIRNEREEGDEKGDPGDSFTVLLTYEDGLLVTAKASQLSAEEDQLRYWVRGDKGSWRKHWLDYQEDQLVGGMKADDKSFGREPLERSGTLTLLRDGKPLREKFPNINPPTWVEYYRLVAGALAGEGEVPVKPEESASVIKLIELLKESAKTGQTVEV